MDNGIARGREYTSDVAKVFDLRYFGLGPTFYYCLAEKYW
jgi:hypothetical protein